MWGVGDAHPFFSCCAELLCIPRQIMLSLQVLAPPLSKPKMILSLLAALKCSVSSECHKSTNYFVCLHLRDTALEKTSC